MRILVTSDGPDTLERAADYTALFASDADVTLLTLYREREQQDEATDSYEAAAEDIEAKTGTPVQGDIERGDAEDLILNEIEAVDYDLVVLGIHLHRKLSRLRPKYVAQHLAGRVSVPLLVVFPAWESLERILVWTAGEQPDDLALRLAGQMAAEVGAEVTVLHVMSQVPLRADADVDDLERDAASLIEHKTREGQFLERALSILQEQGVPADSTEVKVRHGLTVNEIIEESEEGDFDLVVVGALEVPSEESWHELLELVQEDLAERVLMEAKRPVLIARESGKDVDWSEF